MHASGSDGGEVRLQARAIAASAEPDTLLRDLDEMDTDAQASRGNKAGTVRVYIPSLVAKSSVIPELPKFFARNSDIRLDISIADRHPALDVLAGHRSATGADEVEERPLWRCGHVPRPRVSSAARRRQAEG